MAERCLDADTVLTIVVPCYNEQQVLHLLYERITAACRTWPVRCEVVLVDDGSTDSTWDILCDLQQRDPAWKAVRLARNFGHQLALWTGLQHATGDVIAVLDADLQDPPEILPQFLARWQQGDDVVYGVRRKRKEGWLKRACYFSFYRILSLLSEIPIPLDSGDFCIMDRQVLDAMLQFKEQEPFVRGLRAWVGFQQSALEYERDARAAGEVKYTFRKLVALAMNGVLSSSTRPLRLASFLGFAVSITAFLGAVLTVFQRLFSTQLAAIGLDPVPGFATTVVAMLFLGGVQLICLGILGEYVGRIYANSKGRPQSVVSETRGFHPHLGVYYRKSA